MLSFAHDINLNLPAFDPSWSDFFRANQCRERAYFELKRLSDDLRGHYGRIPACGE